MTDWHSLTLVFEISVTCLGIGAVLWWVFWMLRA